MPYKCKQYLRLFTNRTWHTRSDRPKREFCTDTFRLTIRVSRARDVYAIIVDVTTPYEPLYVIVSIFSMPFAVDIVYYLATSRQRWQTVENVAIDPAPADMEQSLLIWV